MTSMTTINVLFFGSTTDSVIVLNTLYNLHTSPLGLSVVAVVTQPPRPVGRKQAMTPTPVEIWAKDHNVTTLSFPTDPKNPTAYQNEQTVMDTLAPLKADLLVSASYGQKIPIQTIREAAYGGLNVHPSVLPRWRGADPVPWAILSGDNQTGVTIVTLSEQFDGGKIIAQKKIAITGEDETDTLRAKLFTMGADLLAESLPDYLSGKNKGAPQNNELSSYARRLRRDDGFEPWESIEKALSDTVEAERIDRKFRAFTPWPGIWTTMTGKRLKILNVSIVNDRLSIHEVQLEGKKPLPWEQFNKNYHVVTSLLTET